MVLYCREQLGLSDRGYGLLSTMSAVGGLLGSAPAPRMQARFGGSLLVGLVIESLTSAMLGMSGSALGSLIGGPMAAWTPRTPTWRANPHSDRRGARSLRGWMR